MQSSLFNQYLTLRQQDGLLCNVLPGDVMAKRPVGGMFTVTDVDREQSRFKARETVHTGPIFGRKMFPAAGAAAEREAAVLAAAELTSTAFSGFGKLLPGTRRHNVIYPENLAAETTAEGIRLCFSLPAGSYATVLLAEIIKGAIPMPESEAD
jgi:tRNA pseudouridine13 synthase